MHGLSDTPFEDGYTGFCNGGFPRSETRSRGGHPVFLLFQHILLRCFQSRTISWLLTKQRNTHLSHLSRATAESLLTRKQNVSLLLRTSPVSRDRIHYVKEFASRNIDSVHAWPSLMRNAGLDRQQFLRCRVNFLAAGIEIRRFSRHDVIENISYRRRSVRQSKRRTLMTFNFLY